jgi:hypothetical protein
MVRNFLLAITLAVSLVVPVAAQSAPHPFSQRQMTPAPAVQDTGKGKSTPATAAVDPAQNSPNIVVWRTPGSKIDERLNAAIEHIIKKQAPDPLQHLNPSDPSRKNGADSGDLTEAPLVVCFAVALLFLLVVWSYYHFRKSNEKRAEEERRRREDGDAS